MSLDQSIDLLPRTSPLTIKRFKSLNITTYNDLINYFPTRYIDYSLSSPIINLQEGEVLTIQATVVGAKQRYMRRGMSMQKITLQDPTGKLELTWFNQPYLLTFLKIGANVSVSGEVKRIGSKLSLDPKEYELVEDEVEQIHTGRIIPIYSGKRGLSSRTIREKVWYVLKENNPAEFLPQKILSHNAIISEADAYKNIHFPKDRTLQKNSQHRLAFDETFLIQLSAKLIRESWEKEKVTNPFKVEQYKKQIDSFTRSLPFELTASQQKVIEDILTDLAKGKPMNRFLQGDVGSGKTVVAALSCYIAYLNGYQSIIMAPTEILASQHYQTMNKLFKKDNRPQIHLVTSSSRAKDTDLKQADILLGTHALIQKKIVFKKVGLVVIDEQHRFGVAQRAMLKKKGVNPHLLTMTATPIPRTAALALYGELDLSVIDKMPKGRMPVKTYLVPREKRKDAYTWISKKIMESKAQVFLVCPLIEESIIETMKSVKAAKKEYEYLQKEIFPTHSLALLHGKLKISEKDTIMKKFRSGLIDILISTTVVEVGVDIPNATIMMIEGAERYGLAQLHQLRGRVGRGDNQSYCLLFTESNNQDVKNRLIYFAKNTSGMKLAEYDLKKRGAGELYGSQQHGISDLKIASLFDYELFEKTRKAAGWFFIHYKKNEYPRLEKKLLAYQTDLIAKD